MSDPYLTWTAESLRSWRRAIGALRSVKYPQRITDKGNLESVRVIVRRIKMDPENYGGCDLVAKPDPHFTLEINRELCPMSAMDTLAHEWAHALQWVHGHLDDHHPAFWLAVGECTEIIWEQR